MSYTEFKLSYDDRDGCVRALHSAIKECKKLLMSDDEIQMLHENLREQSTYMNREFNSRLLWLCKLMFKMSCSINLSDWAKREIEQLEHPDINDEWFVEQYAMFLRQSEDLHNHKGLWHDRFMKMPVELQHDVLTK